MSNLASKSSMVARLSMRGGQHFIVLIADLEHLTDNGETIGRGKSFLHGEANLGVDNVHLHGELLPVDRVLRTPGVVSAPVEMQLQHLITLTLTENIRRSSHNTVPCIILHNTKHCSVAIVGHMSIESVILPWQGVSVIMCQYRTEPVIAFKIELSRSSICQTVLGPLHVDRRLTLTGAILKACFPELRPTVAFIAPVEIVHALDREIAMSKAEGRPLWVLLVLVDATIQAVIPGKLAGVALAEELVEHVANLLFCTV